MDTDYTVTILHLIHCDLSILNLLCCPISFFLELFAVITKFNTIASLYNSTAHHLVSRK